MTKNTLLYFLVALVALVGGISVQHFASPKQQQIITSSLNISLPDLTGKQHNINEWKDKVLLINFWATWCPPCLKEIPEFIHLQDEFKEKGLQFIGIAVEDKQAVADYIDTININYPILIGGDQAIVLSQQLGNIVNTVPFSIIVNRQGQIVHRQAGEFSREDILAAIKPLL